MRLYKKILLITGVTLICLILLMYFTSMYILMSSFTQLEQQDTQKNVQRAVMALSDDVSALDKVVGDWAAWDETYAFIQGNDPSYIERNAPNATFEEFDLNLMLFINSSGGIVYARGFDPDTGEDTAVPESIKTLPADNILLKHADKYGDVKGIILLPEAPMMVSSRPILDSDRKKPILGSMIWGRYLRDKEIQQLENITHLSLSVYRFDDKEMPADFRAALGSLSKNESIVTRQLDEQTVGGYTLVNDIYGAPALLLGVKISRAIYNQGKMSIQYLLTSLLAIGIVFAAVTVMLLDRFVLSRLNYLSVNVGTIGTSGDISKRVSIEGKDELSDLAHEINTMLESLEKSQKELCRKEEMLKQTLSNLANSNKELEQFAHLAAHDLQEPLRMVSCYVQMLEQRYKGRLDADADEFIAYAADGAKHMSKMINDLLTYCNIDKNMRAFEPVNFEAILDTALYNLAEAIKQSNAQVTHDPMPSGILADGAQLLHVFNNLIDNAIKFHGMENPRVHVSVQQKGEEWVFSVRDNGIGIEPQFYDSIFMIFQRLHTRDKYTGTGIGLATCKKIVELHRGRIWVESEMGKGSTFYFTIPQGDGHGH